MNKLGPNSGSEYQVVSGVATGAINAHILAQHQVGYEADAVAQMEQFWRDIAAFNGHLYKSWDWGFLSGLFF